MIVSNHAAERFAQRVGGTKHSAERVAKRALEYGVQCSQTTGALYAWMEAQAVKKDEHTNVRLYGNNLYIFKGDDDVLVTVLTVPGSLMVNHKRYLKA